MDYDKAVSDHYMHGDLLEAIQAAISQLGKSPDDITVDDLAAVDEFHIGGQLATENLIEQLGFIGDHHLLDVGCGLGGAARYIAHRRNSRVTGIDLTDEYIETGRALCEWLNLHEQVSLHQGSATRLPFDDASFDGGYMLHVGMNIEDKTLLFEEIYRVLRPGSSFGVYDVMRINAGDLAYPVPWAIDHTTSRLATPAEYRQAMEEAGFEVSPENNRRDFALEFFRRLKTKTEAEGGPPALGLHTLMKESTPLKIKNMIDNISADYIAPVEIIITRV